MGKLEPVVLEIHKVVEKRAALTGKKLMLAEKKDFKGPFQWHWQGLLRLLLQLGKYQLHGLF